jgi:hypothetical protein
VKHLAIGMVLVLTTAGGCHSRPETSSTGPTAAARLEDEQLDRLIAALDTVQGDFQEVGDAVHAFVSESRVLERIAGFDRRALPKLVDCLGHPQMAQATAFGRRIRVGVLCAEALIYTDFFQRRNSSDQWPSGFQDSTDVDYDADVAQLRRAQRHWRLYLTHEMLTK